MSTPGTAPDAQVADVMRRRFVLASPAERLSEIRQTMRLARLRHLVVAEEHRLVGLVSYRVVLERLLDGRAADEVVSVAMVPCPACLSPATRLDEAAARLCRYGFGCLPVIEGPPEDERVVGLLTETDLLRVAFRRQGRPQSSSRSFR